jgi:hypothetical protein
MLERIMMPPRDIIMQRFPQMVESSRISNASRMTH